jgi:hypothetical protein
MLRFLLLSLEDDGMNRIVRLFLSKPILILIFRPQAIKDRSMNKIYKNAEEALHGVQDGMTFMLGGFGLCGIPENCISSPRENGNQRPYLHFQ